MKKSIFQFLRKREFFAICFSGTVMFFLAIPCIAQDRLSLQFRPGVSFATTDLGDAGLKKGFSFEGTFAYRFMPHLSAYAGWGWNHFSSSQSFAGTDPWPESEIISPSLFSTSM